MKVVKHHAPYSAKSSPLFSTSLPGLVVVVEMMMVVMVSMVVVKNKVAMVVTKPTAASEDRREIS